MQLAKILLPLAVAASSASASVIVSRQSSNSSAPDVPSCTNPDPSCNVYDSVMVCMPCGYQIVGNPDASGSSGNSNTTSTSSSGSTSDSSSSSGSGSSDDGTVVISSSSCTSINGGPPTCTNGGGRKRQSTANVINCDFSTLMCTDGKQLTGCRVQGNNNNVIQGETGGGTCSAPQGDGRNTGAAAPMSGSMSSSSASSSSAASTAATASFTSSRTANSAAATIAAASTKSNGAVDVRPHAVGALVAVGALASMLL